LIKQANMKNSLEQPSWHSSEDTSSVRTIDLSNRESAKALSAKISELKDQERTLAADMEELRTAQASAQELRERAREDKLAAGKKLQRDEEILAKTADELKELSKIREETQQAMRKLAELRKELEVLGVLGVELYLDHLKKADPRQSLTAIEFILKLYKMEKISITGSSDEQPQSLN